MEKINFKDRISKFPNRKKLKIVSSNEGEIVADVINADEPQVEGTEIDAKILNRWQEVISACEGNATLAKTKVAAAEENSKKAIETSRQAELKAERALFVADMVNKGVNNMFIPIKTSEIFNDKKFISASEEQTLSEEEQAQARSNIGIKVNNFSGEYDDLINKPKLADVAISGDYKDIKNAPTRVSDLENDAQFVSKNVCNLENYLLATDTAKTIAVSLDEQTYVLTVNLLNASEQVISSQSIDFPLESMIVGASYADKFLNLTLQNGNTLKINISDVISGLVPETRKINGKILISDITITAQDVLAPSLEMFETQKSERINEETLIKSKQMAQDAELLNLTQSNSNKISKLETFEQNNLPILTEDGALQDSGVNLHKLKTWKLLGSRKGRGDINFTNLQDNDEIMLVATIEGLETLSHIVTQIIPIPEISDADRVFAFGMYFGPENYIGVYTQIANNRLYLNNCSANGASRLDNTTINVYGR